MITTRLIPREEFQRVWDSKIGQFPKLALIADMNRVNTLAAVKRAGSGHIGSSFSAMDIVTWLYYQEMNTLKVGLDNPDRDVYFSSKGHDVPGQYATLYSLGVLTEDQLLRLRRLGGLDGHPDLHIPGIEANSGSLGMGISKGRGMAWAKKHQSLGGRIFVLTGDGEWQEGQNYEALHSAAQQRIDNLVVIIDNNKVQSDKLVEEIMSLGDVEAEYRACGWHVQRINGHDFEQIRKALQEAKKIRGKPMIIIADTIKGRGVSFMEHPMALDLSAGFYPWHSGAPDDENFQKGFSELLQRVNAGLDELGLTPIALNEFPPEAAPLPAAMLAGEPISAAAQSKLTAKVSDEYVSAAYGKELVQCAAKRKDLVVLDADLSADCRLREFEHAYPDRFIECGIAEQDMVSMAGGLASKGLLPVVNSFASFLASRANEQIYNNASEKTKIIYGLHYAGLIPAGPGKSHQSLRDISLLSAVPNLLIVQPCNAEETRLVLDFSIEEASENVAIRLIIGPSPRRIALPEGYQLTRGRGTVLTEGEDGILFAYGPVMLHEALLASELLAIRNFGLKVVNLPWLNCVDADWIGKMIQPYDPVFILEDHNPNGALASHLMQILATNDRWSMMKKRYIQFAVEQWPACGTPQEVLRNHGLDGASIATKILMSTDEAAGVSVQ